MPLDWLKILGFLTWLGELSVVLLAMQLTARAWSCMMYLPDLDLGTIPPAPALP